MPLVTMPLPLVTMPLSGALTQQTLIRAWGGRPGDRSVEQHGPSPQSAAPHFKTRPSRSGPYVAPPPPFQCCHRSCLGPDCTN